MGREFLKLLRAELPDIDPKEMGAVLLIFSSIAASGAENGASALAIGNLAAMIGSYLYTEREL
jgi:hypothetical protein